MPPKKKAKKAKKGTTMSQNVKQSVVVHVNTTKTTRRQPTRSGNRSQPMSRVQRPQFVGVVGQDYSTYNNQLNNISQAIANAIKQPDRTGNLITTPPRQAPDVPIHNINDIRIQKEEQRMMTNEDINVPTSSSPPITQVVPNQRTEANLKDFEQQQRQEAQRILEQEKNNLPLAQVRSVRGRPRTKSQPPSAGIAIASTSQIDRQRRITDFKPTNQGQERGQKIQRISRETQAEELTPTKLGRRPDSPYTKRSKQLTSKALLEAMKELEAPAKAEAKAKAKAEKKKAEAKPPFK